MHNLVKEATGIDFLKFGNDVKTAKEVTVEALDVGHDQDKYAIEACPSVGHVLNEVGLECVVMNLHYNLLFTIICWIYI